MNPKSISVRLFFVSLAIMMVLLIAGCGKESPASASDTGATPSEPAAPSAPTEPATAPPASGDTQANPSNAAESASVRTPQTWNVKIKDFKFLPGDLTIKAGDTVTWTNEDSAPHTATADGGGFDSDRLTKGASFSFTFDGVGSYSYICTIHPSMVASLKVE